MRCWGDNLKACLGAPLLLSIYFAYPHNCPPYLKRAPKMMSPLVCVDRTREDTGRHWAAAGRGHAIGPSTTWKCPSWHAAIIKSNQGTHSCGRKTPVCVQSTMSSRKKTLLHINPTYFPVWEVQAQQIKPNKLLILILIQVQEWPFLCLQSGAKKMTECRYNVVTIVTDLVWLRTTQG